LWWIIATWACAALDGSPDSLQVHEKFRTVRPRIWLDRISVVLFEARVGILQQKCFNKNSATTRFLNFQKRKSFVFAEFLLKQLEDSNTSFKQNNWDSMASFFGRIVRDFPRSSSWNGSVFRLLNRKLWFFLRIFSVTDPPSQGSATKSKCLESDQIQEIKQKLRTSVLFDVVYSLVKSLL
jgi:hypothetical protein